MAIKYPEDRKRFIDDLRAAGLPAGRQSSVELAELLGFSVSHIKNLFYGVNRYGSTTKDKLDAMIAAKRDGTLYNLEKGLKVLDSSGLRDAEPVEQFEVDLPAQDIIDQADDAVSPAGSYLNRLVIGTGYRVEGVPGGGYRITQTVAECVDQSFARAICDLLNGEKG